MSEPIKEEPKPEEEKSCTSPSKIGALIDKATLYGAFNPCSEPGSSDADVPKLKPLNQKAVTFLA